jgi:hypothetical protein
MGTDIKQFEERDHQWQEIAQKLEECREHLLFLGEGTYQTEHAHWFVLPDGSIIAQPVNDLPQQTELFKDDET